MPVNALLKTCWKKGIQLQVSNNNLSFNAAKNAMTDQILSEIKANKLALVELLTQQAGYYDARPLSANERALWFLYCMQPESVAYNMAYSIKLKHYYSREQIQAAFNALCQAHPILIRNYGERDGEPLQWLNQGDTPQIEYQQASTLSAEELDLWIQQQADVQLAPDNNKTCHIALLHHQPQATDENTKAEVQTDTYLTIVIHHIAADFISFEILRQQFLTLLNEQTALEKQYPEYDYQTWLYQQQNSTLDNAEQYWLTSLEGLPQLNLPTDFHHQDEQQSAGAEIQQIVPEATSDKIRQLCQQNNVTPYIFWLSAFQWFMSRLSGQQDFIIGTPSAGRLSPADQELVGYLVNPLALRCQINLGQSFQLWLNEVKQHSQETMQHQAYPFSYLVEKLNVERVAGRSPVFQHMFTLNRLQGNQTADELIDSELLAEQRGAAHELNLVVVDENQHFNCKWRYNNSLYKEQTVIHIQQMFNHWVKQLIENIELTIEQLTTSPTKLLSQLQGNELAVIDNSAWQAFVQQANVNPQHIAICQNERSLNYRQLTDMVGLQAQKLTQQGFAKHNRLGIYLPRSIEQVALMLASWQLGGSFIVLDTEWPLSRVDYIVKDADLAMLVTDESYLAELNSFTWQQKTNIQLYSEQLEQAGTVQIASQQHLSANDEAYLIYTSGSTGNPKAVVVSQQNITNYVTGLNDVVNLPATASIASLSKHSADLGYTALFGALLTGRQLRIIDETLALDSQRLLTELKQQPVDCLKIVPSHLNGLLLAEPDAAFLPTKALIFGGEALTPSVIDNVSKFAGKTNPSLAIYNHYGPTETTIGALVLPLTNKTQDISLGTPLANIAVKVVDNSGHTQAQGLPGELHIAGPTVSLGYLNQAELTTEKFYQQQGKTWYRTGDSVICRDNQIFYIGRIDGQIKIRGHRVELGEIESWLQQYTEQAAIIANKNEQGHLQLVAYLVTDEQSLQQIKSNCEKALPDYMQPSQWMLLEQFPRLANGKVDKKSLQSLSPEQVGSAKKSRALSATEQTLLAIWQELLNKPELTVSDNFFAQGGDSILGLQVIARARAENIQLKPQQLFQHKTIEKLATAIQPQASKEEQVLLTLVQALLNNPAITAQDNFFSVGGDSILSLQLVAKARQENIHLLPKDIFAHKTVANLANALQATNDNNTNTNVKSNKAPELISGNFPLTPIQVWFFAQSLTKPAHWNQSLLINSKTALDFNVLKQAAAKLLQHHASLRLAFNQTTEGWQQHYQSYQENWLTDVVTVSDELPTDEILEQQQGGLDLAKAPLFRVVYFTQSQQLLLTAHHLIVDVVSWQIIVEDFLSLYEGVKNQQKAQLLSPQVEFYQWQQALVDLSKQQHIEQQYAYWQSQLTSTAEVTSDNSYQNSSHHISVLDEALTSSLLNKANAAYNTKPQELLLTALATALTKHWQQPNISIELEGHGRESHLLGNSQNIDLSRTIGWFTARYPQKMAINGESIAENLICHKEQLRTIPDSGLAYGLLRYLNPEFYQQAESWAASNLVSFNYLGQQKSTINDNFSLENGLMRHTRARENQRPHLLDINVMVYNQQLHIDWCYAPDHPKFAQVEQLIKTFKQTLIDIISHCLAPQNGRATATDFPLANIDDSAFVALLTELSH